ncbi:MAG: aminopeptidase P N-terminal domain-containing protein [Clostridium sp.]|nr:MAG: aminopeptidase P N-terminal domain-containing protein [Clostridium sp.]
MWFLFIEPYDEYKAKWVGRGLFKEEATELSGIKDVRYLNSFDSYVSMLCGGCAEKYLY